tara:strand:+ start:1153 stop:2367 length:1215 start_codon:yes stop_codon:yes gene_type:complete
MSKFFKETNNETTKNLFNKSIVYRGKVIRRNDNNIINFNFGEKFLYGRIRRDATPVVPIESTRNIKYIKRIADPATPVQAVSFVADIFELMSIQFQKAVELNKISPTDPYLSNLLAYRAYTSPAGLYLNYKKIVFNTILSAAAGSGFKPENFEQFINFLKRVLIESSQTARFTYPGFVKSRDCSLLASGLGIEIAGDQDATNDDAKIQNFVNSRNWDFYVNTCDTYGFMIDYNNPWRIVADLDSESMREAASKYGYSSSYSLLELGYTAVSGNYMADVFIADLLSIYNRMRIGYWIETEQCGDNSIIKRPKTSQSYTYTELVDNFGIAYFLELFLFIRLHEERPEMPAEQKNKMISEIIQLYRNADPATTPIANFERVINKEFDKVGSFSYINKTLSLSKPNED